MQIRTPSCDFISFFSVRQSEMWVQDSFYIHPTMKIYFFLKRTLIIACLVFTLSNAWEQKSALLQYSQSWG